MTRHRVFGLAWGLLAVALAAARAEASPLCARWTTIDDRTGEPRAVVRIWEEQGVVYGAIEQLFEPSDDGELVCEKCEGHLKDAPLLGLRILWGMQRQGSEWVGGRILDPETGRIYRARMALGPGGDALHIRAYLGLSLFGRSQVWRRLR